MAYDGICIHSIYGDMCACVIKLCVCVSMLMSFALSNHLLLHPTGCRSLLHLQLQS